jgi:competence protein ComEC
VSPAIPPLLPLLLAFLAGLLPALRYPLPLVPLTAIAVGSGLATAALLARARPPRRLSLPLALALALALALTASGAAHGEAAARRAASDCRFALAPWEAVRVVGVLEAGTGERGGEGGVPILPVRGRLEGAGGGCGGVMRVRVADGGAHHPAGTVVEVSGRWMRSPHLVAGRGWPRRGMHAGFVLGDSVVVIGAPRLDRHPLLTLRGRTEARIRGLFPRHDAIAEALLLGRRERLDPALRERFVRAGLVHLLAISGTHVGLLASVLLIVGAVARQPRRRVALATIAAIWFYLAMIGAPASAVRAGAMLSLALLARLLQRPCSPWPILAAAALVLLAWDPLYLLDPGFQLSFSGVGGIIAGMRLARPLLSGELKRRPLARWALEGTLVSTAAFVTTAPITAHHFGAVAPVSIPANLPAIPLLSLALVGVLTAVLIAPLSGSLARLCADGAAVALELLDRVATAAAALPLGHLEVQRPHWTPWIGAALAGAVAAWLAPRLRRSVRTAVAAATAVALLLAWPAVAGGGSGTLELHFLDVGQGDATAIRTPAGRWILVDAGPLERGFDAGERRVLPFLRASGARRLELMILTHPHLDHIGGAPALLRALPVGTVLEPGLPTGSEGYLALLRAVEASGTRWEAARSGRTLEVDGLLLELLWPDPETLDGVQDANQISAVVRLSFGSFAALLTGDAGEEVEAVLVARHGAALRAQLLKAGHHGSSTSTSAAFLAAVGPELVIVSAGHGNRYGHPASSVLRRVSAAGTELARTDRDGTVSVRVYPGDGSRWVRLRQ